MPLYKYIANRFLTFSENLLLGSKLSEFHTGYRAFARKVLETLPLHQNSDDFVFDNEMLAQVIHFNFRIGEISCPTRYFPEASSINFHRSVVWSRCATDLNMLSFAAVGTWKISYIRAHCARNQGGLLFKSSLIFIWP